MKIIKADNEKQMSEITMEMMLGLMYENRKINLSITAGTSPKALYEMLAPIVKVRQHFDNVHYYNFDEIPYKNEERDGITLSDLRAMYFTPANVDEEHIHILNEHNYEKQDSRIAQAGGLDFMLLGIGADGHYCGNLPGTTKFGDRTTQVFMDDSLKERVGRHFEDKEEIPDSYVTMGPKSVMAAKKLVMIATGTKKAEIIERIVKGTVDEKIPATLLTLHPDFTLIVDKEAGALI